MSKKKQREEFKQEEILQAVVIADSFNVRFAPLTATGPRVLLPLVNVSLLDYTLEFLCTSGIEDVIIFCCAHADQIKEHVNNSKWSQESSPCSITVLSNERALSMGDALREIDAQSLIKSDFVLVNGDIVSNMNVRPILEEHKARRLKEKTPIMTMVMTRAPPGHRTRCKEDEIVVAVTTESQRLLNFQRANLLKRFEFPLEVFEDHGDVDLRYDLLDSHISICSPQVPTLFTDEFDYLTRDDFVRGILVNEEIFGNTIHVKVLEDEYAARVSNLVAYDAISKDVMNRWTYPMVPDCNLSGNPDDSYSLKCHNIYHGPDITLARNCVLKENVIIGKGSRVGSSSLVWNTVIGKNCTIGENVRLVGAYVYENVTVERDCMVTSSVLSNGVTLLSNVTLEKGCVLGTNVTVGPDVTLKSQTTLQAEPPRSSNDSDFHSEDDEPDAAPIVPINRELVGQNGKAYLYRAPEESDDEMADLATELWCVAIASDDEESLSDDDAHSQQSLPDSPPPDDAKMFYEEVIGTLERAVEENIGMENLVLEINSLKHAYNIQINEVNGHVVRAICELPIKQTPQLEPPKYLSTFKTMLKKFLPLLKNYIKSRESQLDCLSSLEEVCLQYECVSVALVKMLHVLYEVEILTEEAIIAWHASVTGADSVPERHKLRRQVAPLVKWLEEAEEESDSDGD